MRMCLRTATDDPRDAHLLECVQRSVECAGGIVSESPTPESVGFVLFRDPDDVGFSACARNVAYYHSPAPPPVDWYEALSAFDALLVPSPDLADFVRPMVGETTEVEAIFPPVDLLAPGPVEAPWLETKDSNFRVYTVVPEHEIGVVYPFVKAFLGEYSQTDPVSLLLRVLAPREEAEEALTYAIEDAGVPKNRQPRIRLACGPWGHGEQLALARWGHCCILPWAGCWAPVELAYAMSQGSFVAAPAWSAGGVLTPRRGTLLTYELVRGEFAAPDWDQVADVLRVAVANGRRERVPGRLAVDELLCENGHVFPILMANPAIPSD